MATGTLTGSTIAATYKSLLKVKGGANTILDGDIQIIEDGDGVDSVLGLATDSALISGDGNKLYFYDADGDEHISADASGVLSIAAGAEIDLTATAIDINGTVDLSSTLVVNSNTTITTADNTDTLTLISTDADANVGPVLNLKRSSGSPSDNDLLGEIKFSGLDSGGGAIAYFRLSATTLDVTDNTEDGKLVLTQTVNSSDIDVLSINATEMVFNEGGADKDFRVEGVSAANALFVQGSDGFVGIGTTTPKMALSIAAVNGDPATSGTTPVGNLRLEDISTGNNVMDLGTYDSSPWGSWIQATDRTSLGNGYPLVLNPNGGNVGIGIAAPATPLHVTGDATFTGDLIMADGKGIDFSADASPAAGMTAEILDDYEEGTWSPVVTDGSNPMTMHGSYDEGYYTKVGNLVTVTGYLLTSSKGAATGNIKITGLPFTIANSHGAFSGGGAAYGSEFAITAGESVSCYGSINSTDIILVVWNVTAGALDMQASEWNETGRIMLGFSYRAA